MLTYFISGVRGGWLMILLLYLSLWGAAAQKEVTGWSEGREQVRVFGYFGEHKGVIWNYESVQTLAWILQEPKTHQAGHNFYLSCWDVKEMDSEVCLDWIVHSSSYRTYWALMSWWWERHGAALGTPAEIWHTISMFFKWPCTPVVPTSNKERIVLR